jgi:3-oxoacyl-[acyl-carrier protein] reductase
MQMNQLNGRVAIVTGSGRGIGQQIALRLARDGANIVVNDLDDVPAAETVRLVEGLGRNAVICNGDVTAPDFGERIIKTAVEQLGGVHILVNNAGYTLDSVIQKMTDEQWYAILDVHATAPFRILRAFANHIRAVVPAEQQAGQRIVRKVVNISSGSGVLGNAGQINYSAAKAALIGMTKTLAKEWGRYAVTVNCVAFGMIDTRLTKPLAEGDSGTIDVKGHAVKVGLRPERIAQLNNLIPLGRGGTAEEAAGSVYLFCSPDSDYVSGQVILVNGGA